jgi:hypothetical protein
MGMGMPMGAPAGDNAAPAGQMLAPLAMLAQEQQGALTQLHQQEMMLKEAMRQQILRLVSMMPTENPAGMAARTEPMPPSMSASDQTANGPSSEPGVEPSNMASGPNAY